MLSALPIFLVLVLSLPLTIAILRLPFSSIIQKFLTKSCGEELDALAATSTSFRRSKM